MKYKAIKPSNETERDMLYQLQLFYDTAKEYDDYSEYSPMVLFANCVFGKGKHVGIRNGLVTLFKEAE